MAPGPVHGANLICRRVGVLNEYLNKNFPDSEGPCLKWKSCGFGQVLQKIKSERNASIIFLIICYFLLFYYFFIFCALLFQHNA